MGGKSTSCYLRVKDAFQTTIAAHWLSVNVTFDKIVDGRRANVPRAMQSANEAEVKDYNTLETARRRHGELQC